MKAIELLKSSTDTLVAINGDTVYRSDKKGIIPIMDLLDGDKKVLLNASVADKIIGGAAAFLLVYGGVSEVYGETMSDKAVSVLENAGIPFTYGTLVPHIKNRSGDDLCPLERLCLNAATPTEAYKEITEFLL
ncbi:MAG: DUF1893 domain-containing protein [Firmicutes bacterium HGW-Firmicutes-21]|nr:MAG: DUF1893 domain-containing protein [Firmicutes bacterium HGW-Firmicutes-21]